MHGAGVHAGVHDHTDPLGPMARSAGPLVPDTLYKRHEKSKINSITWHYVINPPRS